MEGYDGDAISEAEWDQADEDMLREALDDEDELTPWSSGLPD